MLEKIDIVLCKQLSHGSVRIFWMSEKTLAAVKVARAQKLQSNIPQVSKAVVKVALQPASFAVFCPFFETDACAASNKGATFSRSIYPGRNFEQTFLKLYTTI